MLNGEFKSYWSETASYETIVPLINMDFDGLKSAVIEMLSGAEVKVNTETFKNDTVNIQNRDEVLTYERCAESDKKFIFAMVECGELPCTISNVAHNLNKTVGSISTTRAQLISKGIIYPVRYKELDFTVPEFSGYIQRLEEYKQWCISK